jgi:16S rRNA C1402 (ribose-2'-O) methylase RsmI
MSANVNEILENISSLPPEDQFFICETLNKRVVELKRFQIAKRGEQARENYEKGEAFSGSVKDLMKAMNDD